MWSLAGVPSAEPTPHRRDPPARLAMLAQSIARRSARAASRGRQSLGRAGTARSTTVEAGSPDILQTLRSAQRWSGQGRILAGRSIEVALNVQRCTDITACVVDVARCIACALLHNTCRYCIVVVRSCLTTVVATVSHHMLKSASTVRRHVRKLHLVFRNRKRCSSL